MGAVLGPLVVIWAIALTLAVGGWLLLHWPWVNLVGGILYGLAIVLGIAAPVGGRDYGRLGVLAQALCRAETVMDLPARAFTPPPKVASAVVRLTPLAERPSPALVETLQKVTAAAFGQRRKMLRSSLKALGGEALCQAAGLDPNARAETVPVSGFLNLAKALGQGA